MEQIFKERSKEKLDKAKAETLKNFQDNCKHTHYERKQVRNRDTNKTINLLVCSHCGKIKEESNWEEGCQHEWIEIESVYPDSLRLYCRKCEKITETSVKRLKT